MTAKANILARFSGEGSGRPLYLPDLTLWYDWHRKNGTLPESWSHYTLPQIAADLGVPVWMSAQPRRILTPDVEVGTTEQSGERIIHSETSEGALTARWILGPDGAWWQTEYPVKTAADLVAVLELAKARSYESNPDLEKLDAAVGDNGIVAIEIPRRPFSDLLHEFLGWGEGLMLLHDEGSIIQEIIYTLEERMQHFVEGAARLPGQIVLSPDNLDGQFISPKLFGDYLADSYRRTAEVLHAEGKYLLVHVGGPVRHLLAPLVATGVDGVEGVAGPPQSDVSLAEAREIVGPAFTLWGGISQDHLLDTYDGQTFEDAVRHAAQLAEGDPRMLVGVADRMPVDAQLSRIEVISTLVEQMVTGTG